MQPFGISPNYGNAQAIAHGDVCASGADSGRAAGND
jgi:hypothetical protein